MKPKLLAYFFLPTFILFWVEHELVSHYLYPSFMLPLFIQLNIQSRLVHELAYVLTTAFLEKI